MEVLKYVLIGYALNIVVGFFLRSKSTSSGERGMLNAWLKMLGLIPYLLPILAVIIFFKKE